MEMATELLREAPQLFHALEPAVEALGTRGERGIENDLVRTNRAAPLDVALYLVEGAGEDHAVWPQGVLGDLNVGSHHHLQRRGVAPRGCGHVLDAIEHLSHAVDGNAGRIPPVGPLGQTSERRRGEGREVNGWIRLLDRLWLDDRLGDVVELALELDRIAGPDRLQCGNELVASRPTLAPNASSALILSQGAVIP
jgi:hypothetical protein